MCIRDSNTPYEQIGDTVTPLEVPFEIPESWEWVRLRDIFSLQAGKNIHTSEIKDTPFKGAVPCYGGNGIRGYVDRYNHNGDYPLIGRQGALCGNVNRATGRFYATEHAVCVETFCNTDVGWACLFLEALNLNQYATATAQPGLSVAKINQIVIPVPPLSQQRRIVAKFEELAPKLVLYEKAEIEREKLQSSFPARLKKSILQQAIQGKLVPQDPSDESAEVLLKRIQAEKQRLVREGKIKKDKHESVIFRRDNSHYEIVDGVERCIDEELLFEIPEGWYWTRLMDVCEYIQRGKSPKYSTIKKYPVIAQKCNQWSGFSIEKAQFIEPDSLASYGSERILQDNDLMWNSTGLGTLGRMAIYKATANPYGLAVADSHVTVIRPFKQFVLPEYLYFYFSNPTVQSVIEEQADGTTKQKELATATIKAYWTPIPPLNEQYRIVAKIKELLPLIQSI